jgi:hypothetical protein
METDGLYGLYSYSVRTYGTVTLTVLQYIMWAYSAGDRNILENFFSRLWFIKLRRQAS